MCLLVVVQHHFDNHDIQQKESSITKSLHGPNRATLRRLLNDQVSKWQLLQANLKAYAPHPT